MWPVLIVFKLLGCFLSAVYECGSREQRRWRNTRLSSSGCVEADGQCEDDVCAEPSQYSVDRDSQAFLK